MGAFKLDVQDDKVEMDLIPVLDLNVADELCESFLDVLVADKPVIVRAGTVERITTPCIQVLFAMKMAAEHRGIDFSLVEIPELMTRAIMELGFDENFVKTEHVE